MSARKVLRFSRIFYSWQLRKSLVPSYMPEDISIEVTNTCNFRCHFCPQSDPKHHELVPRISLEPDRAEQIFKNLRTGGVETDTLHWTLDGEPFMNKQFHILCSIAHKHNFLNMIFATNGMLLTQERLNELPLPENAKYTFTIDYSADKEYFEHVRGRKGSWQIIQDNIKASLKNRDHTRIFFKVTDITSYKTLDPAANAEAFRNLQKLFESSGDRISFHTKTFHNSAGLTPKLENPNTQKRYYTCPYPWTSLVIASSGDVVACCRDLRRQTVLGNVFNQSVPEIWCGAAFQELRKNLADRTPWKSAACDGCDMPYDASKFSLRNIVRTARNRLQIFSRR